MELVKGDYTTARNKIENGEYVDFRCYIVEDGAINTEFAHRAVVYDSYIVVSISVDLYWTADGISTKDTNNPGDPK